MTLSPAAAHKWPVAAAFAAAADLGEVEFAVEILAAHRVRAGQNRRAGRHRAVFDELRREARERVTCLFISHQLTSPSAPNASGILLSPHRGKGNVSPVLVGT